MTNDEVFNKLFDKLEPMPDALGMDRADAERLDISCQYSIAISLKRIADKLELSQKQPIIMTAEEYARFLEQQK